MREIAIKVDNISKKFNGTVAVKNLSFSVNRAECFGFLGPNGAGKTTVMKILYGVVRRDNPEAKQVSVLGYDPLYNPLEIKYLSGIVPQEDNLDIELNVSQNLLIYSKFYGIARKEATLRIENLLDFMDLKVKKNTKIRDLSGGMKRRLIIARALINLPRLLILDEPTTGLDPQVRHLIWDKLRMLKKEGVTILLTTHYMEEAFQLCDNLIIMHNGEKILQGVPVRLINENIEKFVLEIFSVDRFTEKLIQKIKIRKNTRLEKSDSRILIYSDQMNQLKKISHNYRTGDYFLRQSNLEDLFLKVTGRTLNE
jgi:lipooligosaccharide transport system ATP-binding protein